MGITSHARTDEGQTSDAIVSWQPIIIVENEKYCFVAEKYFHQRYYFTI